MKRLLILAAAIASAAVFAVPAVAAADSSTSNSLSYEFDNGSTWTLHKNTAALNTTYPIPGYSDAGIVVDLGPLSSLTGNGITVTGSGVSDNIWISPGTTEANTPGTHSLSATVDFPYGFDNGNGTFYMVTGVYAGTSPTLAQLQTQYPNAEAYAWVGVVYSGASVSGSVSSVNGHATGNRTASFTNKSGTVTAVLR
jgi:hypothetical protein